MTLIYSPNKTILMVHSMMVLTIVKILTVIHLLGSVTCTVLPADVCDLLDDSWGSSDLEQVSAEIKKHIYFSHLPKAGSEAGKYSKLMGVEHWESCMNQCCIVPDCDVVLYTDDNCYHISCNISLPNACQPVDSSSPRHSSTVMVTRRNMLPFNHPTTDMVSVDQPSLLLDAGPQQSTLPPTPSSSLSASNKFVILTTTTRSWSPVKQVGDACLYGVSQCVENSDCFRAAGATNDGIGHCVCKDGYSENMAHGCDKRLVTGGTDLKEKISMSPEMKETTPAPTRHTAQPTITELTVSAGTDKTIQLPENSVTLTAFVLPKPEQGETYTYEWSPVKVPDDAVEAIMDGKNTDTFKISNLKAGLYVLKIKVTGHNKFGEALINVTVLPPARQNQPPVAIIHNPTQEVYLPNVAILDGSDSTDDDKIVSYKWEEVSGPLQNSNLNHEGQMLTLKDLVPGNYTFRLTVTDSDGATNSTSANVTIKKEKDYPPKADAGSDVVIHLPQTSLTLYGNSSSDDKEALTYEWIKVSDNKLPAEMMGVRTAFLQLSNLEVGDYKFTLKVTDSAGQTDTADVQVFVKPETNHPPVARTAAHLQIYLPQDSLTLDGSNSTDDTHKMEYQWTQKGGPSTLTITNPDKVVAIATGKILEGDYEFQLTVIDGERQQSSASLVISVKKDINLPPKANAGGNKVVQVPVSLVTLDGSKSNDDRGITKYLWQRDSKSPAAGAVVNSSDHKAVLQLVNLVAGQYLFTLTVEDGEGLSSSDTATIVVNKNVNEKHLVEMILDANIDQFTTSNEKSLGDQLELMLHRSSEDRDTVVEFVSITEDVSTGHLCLTFQVLHQDKGTTTVMDGLQALKILKSKVSSGKILDYTIVRLDMLVCQNNCSGHGHCDQKTKLCVCEAFWMSSFFTSSVFAAESNCDWSILYVVIIFFIILVAIISAIWMLVCCCTSKKCRLKLKAAHRHRYSLLRDMDDDNGKDKIEMMSKGKIQNSSVMISESDLSSDEETLFISSKKASNGINGKISNGSKSSYKNRLKT